LRESEQANYFTVLRAPDEEAAQFAEKMGLNAGSVIGKAIELAPHYTLDKVIPLQDIGISPESLQFHQPSPKDFSEAVRLAGGLKSFPLPDSDKYGIAEFPLMTKDDENFIVKFWQTTWNTYRTVREKIERNPTLRWELSNSDPSKNQIPQSMSLHYLVRFENGDVLALLRKRGIQYEDMKWSFSGEEQINKDDFNSSDVSVAEHLFRRAFIEEVIGHRGEDSDHMNRIWDDDCAPIVASHRLWSFFLEENSGIFQIFGFFQLSINRDRLREIRERGSSSAWGTDDGEGKWYTVTESGLRDFLIASTCVATRLHGADTAIITAASLHSTSRYRLWRLYFAQTRRNTRPATLKSLHDDV
jgi:hypothetical protein